jgi:non-specific serine/threonine protein kinase
MFWLTRGHVSEKRHWLERAVARDAAATAARAETLHGAGILASHQSNYDRAEELTQESYRLFDQLGDKQGIGFTLSSLGILAADQGDFELAKPLRGDVGRILGGGSGPLGRGGNGRGAGYG